MANVNIKKVWMCRRNDNGVVYPSFDAPWGNVTLLSGPVWVVFPDAPDKEEREPTAEPTVKVGQAWQLRDDPEHFKVQYIGEDAMMLRTDGYWLPMDKDNPGPYWSLISEAPGIPLADAVKDIGAVADKMRHHGDTEFQLCRMNDACWLMDGHAGDCYILAVKPVFTRLLTELRRPAPKTRDVVVQEFEFEGRTCWASENPYRHCWIPTGRTHTFHGVPVDDKESEGT